MGRNFAIALLLTLGMASCGSSSPSSSTASLATRSINAGSVEVAIQPVRIDGNGASFSISFDTHSGDLEIDPSKTSRLQVDGRDWVTPSWSGDGPGGHHRKGTLSFKAAGPATGQVRLTIDGLTAPVVADWSLPEGS